MPSPQKGVSREETYNRLKSHLLSQPAKILPPPPSTISKTDAHAISSLLMHPSLEAAFHLLNNDLPSAHFLVRHMQAAPQFESMFLHGILHRIEGDYDNTRAWYRDVAKSDVFRLAWGEDGLRKSMDFVRAVEVLGKESKGKGDASELEMLQQECKREIVSVIEFCEQKYGIEKLDDASSVWVQDENSSVKGSDMVIGGEGWRQF